MTRYEYKHVQWVANWLVEDHLNEFAKAGWKVIKTDTQDSTSGLHYMFLLEREYKHDRACGN